MALFDQVKARLAQQQSNLSAGAAGGLGERIMNDAAFAYLPPELRKIKRQVETGDVDGAVMDLASKLDNKLGSQLIREQFMKTKSKLFGGMTPEKAIKYYQEFSAQPLAKENLFLIEVSQDPGISDSKLFNMFVRSIGYSPFTISGERKQVGGLQMDVVTGSEPVELRISTWDDKQGTIHDWFKGLSSLVAHSDGTVGLPAEYSVEIKITHSYINPDPDSQEKIKALVEKAHFRPVSIETSLDRDGHDFKRLDLVWTEVI